jgi:hypothetical protein
LSGYQIPGFFEDASHVTDIPDQRTQGSSLVRDQVLGNDLVPGDMGVENGKKIEALRAGEKGKRAKG